VSLKGKKMRNPWEEIELLDYENHMRLASVRQLQAMNAMMKQQFCQYPVRTIMILGIAGGNGLEHIDPRSVEEVVGVDINKAYLAECKNRYPELQKTLRLLCLDLTGDIDALPRVDLVVANLLLEYIGYAGFQRVITKVAPQYVSCGIQINTDIDFVSESPYLHVFDDLHHVHHQIVEQPLITAMADINYQVVLRDEMSLPNGKKLVRVDFQRQTD
jgi:Methyltransferase domain.